MNKNIISLCRFALLEVSRRHHHHRHSASVPLYIYIQWWRWPKASRGHRRRLSRISDAPTGAFNTYLRIPPDRERDRWIFIWNCRRSAPRRNLHCLFRVAPTHTHTKHTHFYLRLLTIWWFLLLNHPPPPPPTPPPPTGRMMRSSRCSHNNNINNAIGGRAEPRKRCARDTTHTHTYTHTLRESVCVLVHSIYICICTSSCIYFRRRCWKKNKRQPHKGSRVLVFRLMRSNRIKQKKKKEEKLDRSTPGEAMRCVVCAWLEFAEGAEGWRSWPSHTLYILTADEQCGNVYGVRRVRISHIWRSCCWLCCGVRDTIINNVHT